MKKFFKGIITYFKERPYYIKQAYIDSKLMYSVIYNSNKEKMDKYLGVKKK